MSEHIPCEFALIRYVPDVVKGEFTNIGVILREVRPEALKDPEAARKAVTQVRFTRDWRRVRCIDPGAHIELFESFEDEIASLLISEATGPIPLKPVLALLRDTLSNSIQITEPSRCLAESFAQKMDELMQLYIEPIRIKVTRERTGRTAIHAAMRTEFDRTGVWTHMRKRIASSLYTRPGDPMKLDCGYRPNGVIRIFHAVSLANDVEAAKGLAYSAPQLREGVFRVESASLHLTAVVEPIREVSGQDPEDRDFSDEAGDRYRFGVEAMEREQIRVITINDLARAAETARTELRL